jgi:hypothetical protein
MQTGSPGTLIGWKSGQTTFVPLWDRMEGAWLRTQTNEKTIGLKCMYESDVDSRTSNNKLPNFNILSDF